MKSFDFKVWNKHVLIESEGSILLIDTGSPKSYHQDGVVKIGESEYIVLKNLMGIDSNYLTNKVGCKISGLVGMDIMNQYSIWFNSPKFGNFILFSDKNDKVGITLAGSASKCFMDCPTIFLNVNKKLCKFLFDSGASVSYVSSKIVDGMETCGKTYDFSPLLQSDKYEVDLYYLETELDSNIFNAFYGKMPSQLEMILSAYNIEGIIGFDLINNFRLLVVDGQLYLPPQGI